MSSVNLVCIMGRVGKDPDLKQVNGKNVANFSVCTSIKKSSGDEIVEWHRIVAWEKQADICKKFLVKGKGVHIQGRLQTREWEKDGQKHYTTEIIANSVTFTPGNKNDSDNHNQASQDDDW